MFPPSYTVLRDSFMGQLSRFKYSICAKEANSLGSVIIKVFLRSSSYNQIIYIILDAYYLKFMTLRNGNRDFSERVIIKPELLEIDHLSNAWTQFHNVVKTQI